MARIAVPPHIPGIVSLFAFRPESAAPLSALAEQILRGPSPLSSGERELIAAFVSTKNDCNFCARSHGAAAAAHLGSESLVDRVRADFESVPASELSDKMKALLRVAAKVRESGLAVTDADVEKARTAGASDVEIHDAVLIAAAFCMFNRYVDGLATLTPDDPSEYREMGKMLAFEGYVRSGTSPDPTR